jgi:CBS domain-containing protein
MNVAAILKTKGRAVATAERSATLQDIINLLAAKRIGAIIIVDAKDDVEGIVSERDVVRAVAAHGAACLTEPVARFMTRDVITCEPHETLDQLMSTMTTGRFRHVPVVEGEHLVGIVSIGDAVKHHIAEVELEASALKSYVLAG